MSAKTKSSRRKEEVRLGHVLYAHHREWVYNEPFRNYYFTAKKHPRIGHNIYIISGQKLNRMKYYPE
jgi:hypothetical protein